LRRSSPPRPNTCRTCASSSPYAPASPPPRAS
jgi:hypothetical protein